MSGRFQRPVSFADIRRRVERLESYTGLYHAYAVVLYPRNRDEVSCIFGWAAQRNRRVTLRAGGHSFDAQALGTDLVMSMMCMDKIDEPDIAEECIRVDPGATWGRILCKLEPLGLVPAVTVTTEHATAGGTLSGNCLSRFSPAYGKEGEWVRSFDIVTPDGEVRTCTRPDDPANPASLEEHLFLGAIGGLGYLGAVVSITYELLYVCQTGGKIGVDTTVHQYTSFRALADDLVPAVLTANERPDPCDEDKRDSVWAAVFADESGRQDGLLFESSFTAESRRRRMGLHQPGLAFRVLVEWAMTVPPVPTVAWRLAYRFLYPDCKRFIDDLRGFTFFMDGNRNAKRLAKTLFRWTPKTVQQTFIVPSVGRDPGERLVCWLEYAHGYLSDAGLTPTLQDILWLPKDLPFRLSATAEEPGFAVSYAFETSDHDVVELAKRAFTEMSDVLWEVFGGRVYLVKNVCARPETLADMYGQNARDFFALKNEVDPERILVNSFLKGHFGKMLEPSLGTRMVPEG